MQKSFIFDRFLYFVCILHTDEYTEVAGMPRQKSSIPRLFDGPEYGSIRKKQGWLPRFKQRATITCYIEAEVKEELRQRAYGEGISLSELTRRIVEAWLRGECYGQKKV